MRSLLFGEVELMETLLQLATDIHALSFVASLRRSGINGNSHPHFSQCDIILLSLLFGEVELMETCIEYT